MTHELESTLDPSPRSVLWPQVCGLAGVQGAIALTWVIYNLYLADLLVSVGFPLVWAQGLLIFENLLGIVMEPLMGACSDQAQRWVGSRFPFVAMGLILASVCFLLIPFTAGLLVSTLPLEVVVEGSISMVQMLLPVILVAWALAMTVFRSPALSLLGRYAIGTQLPQAASILTLVGGLAGALGPLASQQILALGAMRTFLIGSLVLVVAALVLRSVEPDQGVESQRSGVGQERLRASLAEPEEDTWSWWGLAWVFGSGVGVALGFRLMMSTFPQILSQRLPEVERGPILGLIFVALAVTAIPAGSLGTWLGNRRAMVVGLGAMAVLLGSSLLLQSGGMAMGIAVGLGAAFSLVSNGTIPFALSMVPVSKAGLGTGIFFSGGAAATSLFSLFLGPASGSSPGFGILLGVIAFLGAGFCILSGGPLQIKRSL